MTSRIRKFLRLGGARRRLLLESGLRLGGARLALARRSFRRLISGLEVLPGEVVHPAGAVAVEAASEIGWAVRTAARFTPWDSSCLVQVLAAQRMMQSRGIGGAICIGGSLGDKAGERFSAHAWLKHHDTFVTGEAGHEAFAVVSTFTWDGDVDVS